MLLDLSVKDFGIIEEIDWRPRPGFNVITGETGAGKSLVVDAVAALLTGKVDEEVIRHGSTTACLEGVFSLPRKKTSPLRTLLCEKGIPVEEDSLLLSVEFRREGRNISRVNRQAVTRGLLGQIGRFFIDIHGQSEHLSLLNKEYQLEFLDAYAHATDLRCTFSAKAQALNQTEHELKTIIEAEKDRARREEFLRFQIAEIKSAHLKEEEEAQLETERNILASSEALKRAAFEAYGALYGEELSASTSALEKLNEAIKALSHYANLDAALKRQLEYLEETASGLEEAARDIRSYGERLEFDPGRLEEIESRRELLRNLKRKYGQTVAEMFSYLAKSEQELAGITHSSERRAELETVRTSLRTEMGQIGSQLSQQRSRAADRLAKQVKKELRELSMAQVEFAVSITREQIAEGIPLPDGSSCAFNKDGIDNIEFLASTNPGEPLKSLAKIASTGEISRFMLALKSALSEVDDTPVLIFDEIDIGVGGRSGEVLGKKLWRLALNRQVICVTHLPQIAAFADAHYSVHKEIAGKRTTSRIEAVEKEARLKEIAAMLSGDPQSEATLNNARELLQKAQDWKKAQG